MRCQEVRLAAFVPGLELADGFYREVVAPILERAFPRLPSSAALLGTGSEVLGFDTERSTDHEWGPRLQIFLGERDHAEFALAIHERLRHELPTTFRGYPTHFGPTEEEGIRRPTEINEGPVDHKVEVTTFAAFLIERLGTARWRDPGALDWLTFSQQGLLEVTAGRVFHDGLGELAPARAALAWYPHDVWLYLLAAQWARIGQMEAFVGRCGEVGDEAGSALVAATLARDVMALGFLMERRYAPYPKWFGTAFAGLGCAPRLLPHFEAAVAARTWPEREAHLGRAYEVAAAMHNALGLTEPLPERVSAFWGRPFRVIHGDRFAAALHAAIATEEVRQLPSAVGAVDQWVESTDVLSRPDRRRRLRAIYEPDG